MRVALRQSSGEGVGAALEWDQPGAGAAHLAPAWQPWASPCTQGQEGQSSWMGPGVGVMQPLG